MSSDEEESISSTPRLHSMADDDNLDTEGTLRSWTRLPTLNEPTRWTH